MRLEMVILRIFERLSLFIMYLDLFEVIFYGLLKHLLRFGIWTPKIYLKRKTSGDV